MEFTATVETKGKIFEGKAPEIIQQALTAAMYEATQFLEAEVKKRTPIGVSGAKGGLVSTIYGEVVEKGAKGIIGHQSAYGDVIEKGRTAGKKWPPEGVLLTWIKKILGVEGPFSDVKSRRLMTAAKLEFLIRRKIGQKGFPGVHMFERAFKEGMPRLEKIFDDAGFKITEKLNE
jgi:hypothetical protein